MSQLAETMVKTVQRKQYDHQMILAQICDYDLKGMLVMNFSAVIVAIQI